MFVRVNLLLLKRHYTVLVKIGRNGFTTSLHLLYWVELLLTYRTYVIMLSSILSTYISVNIFKYQITRIFCYFIFPAGEWQAIQYHYYRFSKVRNCKKTILSYQLSYRENINHYMGRVKQICVFEHSVMTNFNRACPAIQKGQGSGFLSESSSWLTADAQARLNLRCSHRR